MVNDEENFEAIFLATGSEVEMALDAAKILKHNYNRRVRVVSMPSQELFLRQDKEYQNRILPNKNITIAMEMGSSMSWYRFADTVYGIDEFGRSGKGEEVQEYFGFTPEKFVNYYLSK